MFKGRRKVSPMTNEGEEEEEKGGGEGADAGRWMGERGRTQTGDVACGVGKGLSTR